MGGGETDGAGAAGDLEARFVAFVGAHRDRARRLAWRLVGADEAGAEDVAEDLAQDAFVRAYRALGRFREESSFETWFYRILVRRAANHRRWRRVRNPWGSIPGDEAADSAAPGPGDPVLRRRIAAALERLSRFQREAFVLVHLEGFTVAEAAALMAKPEGTVKSHLHRALVGLRAELRDLRDPRDPGEGVEP